MKIDARNFLSDRFSLISDINRLININLFIDIDYMDYWFSLIGHTGYAKE